MRIGVKVCQHPPPQRSEKVLLSTVYTQWSSKQIVDVVNMGLTWGGVPVKDFWITAEIFEEYDAYSESQVKPELSLFKCTSNGQMKILKVTHDIRNKKICVEWLTVSTSKIL